MFSALTEEAWATAMMVAMETMQAMTERETRLPCNGAETSKDSTDSSNRMKTRRRPGRQRVGKINQSISRSLSLSSLASLRHSAAFLVCLTGAEVIDAGESAGGGVGGDGGNDGCD